MQHDVDADANAACTLGWPWQLLQLLLLLLLLPVGVVIVCGMTCIGSAIVHNVCVCVWLTQFLVLVMTLYGNYR